MTKAAALNSFFSSFGIPAYERNRVPDSAKYPYLTYDYAVAALGDGEVALTVDLWYYTENNTVPNAKAAEMSAAISLGGKMIPCDEGYIWLKRGSPWCQSLPDPNDRSINRRHINVSAEYLTRN